MIYLALSILCSSLIYLCFKLIHQNKAHTLSSLIVNYWVAGTTGLAVAYFVAPDIKITLELLLFTAFLGFLFISIFLVMANTTQQFGVGTASVSSKMSVVVPVLIGLFYFKDSLTLYKTVGLILALVSVYLVSKKKSEKHNGHWWLPIILFLGSGTIDSLIKFGQHNFHSSGLSYWMVPMIFVFAGIYGTAYALGTKKQVFGKKELKLGGLLGIINFGSMIFLVLTLAVPHFESSFVFPVNNVGVVTLSSILGIFVFKEKASKVMLLGISLAILSTILISLR